MAGERKIVIGIDGSENAEKAFNYFLEHLYKPKDHIIIVHVVSPPKLNALSLSEPLVLPADDWKKSIDESVQKTKKVMEKYEIICESKKIPKTPELGTGKPGEAIVAIAKKHGATLIVVGSRGYNTLRRTFMGSVSDYVLHHSNIPVVVVPIA